jgi:hypothetical protein
MLCDSVSLRRLVAIDLGAESVLNATTIHKLRHLVGKHKFVRSLIRPD